MTNIEQLLLRLVEENKLKPYDIVNLEFGNYCYKHNIDPSINHNIAPTLTTSCNLAIVLKEEK